VSLFPPPSCAKGRDQKTRSFCDGRLRNPLGARAIKVSGPFESAAPPRRRPREGFPINLRSSVETLLTAHDPSLTPERSSGTRNRRSVPFRRYPAQTLEQSDERDTRIEAQHTRVGEKKITGMEETGTA